MTDDLGKNPNDLNGPPLRERLAAGAPAGARAAVATVPAREKEKPAAPAEPKDGTREVIDTIVIVVVLVLLLKGFLAEAFVIPTGSMATTLLGYHKVVTCPSCDHVFEVNFSKEADAAEENPQRITGCWCPNCRQHIELAPPEPPRRGPGP